MSTWSLPRLLERLHDDIERRLATVRETFEHAGTKGDASEHVWLEFLKMYLPERYRAERAHIVDSRGAFSQQLDVVVFDRHYSPLIFNYEGQIIIPAESIYAVFEAKQSINATYVAYAQEKAASVRRLYRTSLPITHAGGTYEPRPLPHILAGILTFESDWSPPLRPRRAARSLWHRSLTGREALRILMHSERSLTPQILKSYDMRGQEPKWRSNS